MSKHTPGPWDHGSYEVESADGSLICNMSGWRGPEVTKANARLIAAAPELLEALRGLLASMSLRQIDSARINPAALKAINAIDKATGSEQ